ncbi:MULTISPECIES: hypothetical protein [Nonomuraea]|jgi:hypothetical protein|uniref:DUF4383 domain-containing protein n=1 Tax=Nonomuraea salmonea TaxID=46181 RepID=A0ABV5NUC3_9ACTN
MDLLRRVLAGSSAVYALVFLTFALAHAGVGIGPLREPVIAPAVVVETLCAVAVAIGAYGAAARRAWAWDGLLYGHAAALGGVLLGIAATTLSPGGGTTVVLLWYHGVMAAALTAGLAAAFYASRVRG